MKNWLILSILLVTVVSARAQQDPLYAQYMNNVFAINPAYAGTHNMWFTTCQYRSQWTGLSGNPETMNLSSHMPVAGGKVGLGIQVIRDQVGENKRTEFYSAYSYRIETGNTTLYLGLQAGLMNFSNNPDELNILDPDDSYFYQYSQLKFNAGAGLIWVDKDKFMLGISVPRLLPATITAGDTPIKVYSQNYYLYGAYLFLLSDKVRFKPSVLLKGTKAVTPSLDLNANFTFIDKYSAGLFTRNFNTYGVQLNMRFDKYQFGYTFEIPAGKSSVVPFVSHEILLGIRLKAFDFHDQFRVQNF